MLTKGTILQGRYRIDQQIGGGGQAVVYLAEDLNWNVQRAVKQLTPDPTATSQERQEAYKQFRREALVLADLADSNIVRVWDHFHEGGHAYLVMDYVEGRTLQEVMDQTPGFLPEAAVRRWATQLCDVLDYLHQQEPPIIFRDLNPSNVMLDKNDQIKLIDFGIVRHFKAGQTSDTMYLGTPGYAPLEQHGHGQTDERSDIYAFGATLYHLLTKHEPEPAPARVIPGQSDPLQPPRKYNASITSDTEEAVLTAMAVDPDKRFQSVSEMKEALVGTHASGIRGRWFVIAGLVLLIAASFVWQRGLGLSSPPPVTPVGAGGPTTTVVLTGGTSRPSTVPATETSGSAPAGASAATDTPTPTSLSPTETHTVAVATTDTPVPPTATRTSTQIPTSTATATEPPTRTPTFTPIPTDTPTRTRTPTAIPTRTFTPLPSATPTWTQVPTAEPTATESLTTSEPTTFKLAIGEYRLAEKEALRTLDSAAVDELATYAHGEALAAVTQHIEELRAQGYYQELVVHQLEVQHVTLRDGGESAGVLVQEQHILRTYQSSADGNRLIEEEHYAGQIVYGLVYLDSRWKVERIRPLENATP